ncbi:hypothetical protein [Legionella clemsonensis]|uniref:hypothetical protein n=1 Tax=Legionella clemsonensis TaxID=1867846 RepID=UPI000B8D09C4
MSKIVFTYLVLQWAKENKLDLDEPLHDIVKKKQIELDKPLDHVLKYDRFVDKGEYPRCNMLKECRNMKYQKQLS